jgi:hypothetical protein
MSVDYHPEAAAEMIEAAKYYQKRVAGLGSRFLDEVDAAVDRILEGDALGILQRQGWFQLFDDRDFRHETGSFRAPPNGRLKMHSALRGGAVRTFFPQRYVPGAART